MGRSPCCSKEGLNRGAWTASEDQILSDYIKTNGEGSWRNLPTRAGLKRCGKSCRLRWLNYLRPGIKRGNISSDEEELIVRLHKLLGNRWSLIAGRLPGRTDNEIKNYWNTNLAKKIQDHSTSSNSSRKNINHQSKEKKKPIVHSSNEARFRLNKVDSSSSSSPYVVRTKALRCTKLFFTPLANNAETNGLSIQAPLEREGSVAGFSFLPSNKDDNYSTNLMEDFSNPGENCSFSADFSEFCDFDGVILGGDELSPINSDDSILFLDGILHNWNDGGDDCVHQAQPSCF